MGGGREEGERQEEETNHFPNGFFLYIRYISETTMHYLNPKLRTGHTRAHTHTHLFFFWFFFVVAIFNKRRFHFFLFVCSWQFLKKLQNTLFQQFLYIKKKKKRVEMILEAGASVDVQDERG